MIDVAPCLMFVGDQCGRAEEAIELYVSAFPGARVLEVERLESDDGGIKRAAVEVGGRRIVLMDSPAPHQFTFTPAISLFVALDDATVLDAAYAALAVDGEILMPLDTYDFSPRFGWLQDRFGVSWQLILETPTAAAPG